MCYNHEEKVSESDWRQSYWKGDLSNGTYIFKWNVTLPLTHLLIHIHIQKKQQPLPWNHVNIYCNNNADKKDNIPSRWQCVCVHGENKGPQLGEKRKNYSLTTLTKADTRTVDVVLRENPGLKTTLWWDKLSPLFSIWILFDVIVDASTKENTRTMRSVFFFFWTKTRRGRRAEARPCLCL